MHRFRVTVVASYPPGVELMQAFVEAPRPADVAAGLPPWETSAIEHPTGEEARILPLRQTLTVTCEAEGRNEPEAQRFALAIVREESRRAALPARETIVVHVE